MEFLQQKKLYLTVVLALQIGAIQSAVQAEEASKHQSARKD